MRQAIILCLRVRKTAWERTFEGQIRPSAAHRRRREPIRISISKPESAAATKLDLRVDLCVAGNLLVNLGAALSDAEAVADKTLRSSQPPIHVMLSFRAGSLQSIVGQEPDLH